jgi:hypothetical protein
LFDALIQRLQNTRVNGRNHIHRRVQFFLRHSRFPCIRKAPFHSWVAQSHHRNGQADEHLLSLAETFDGMSVTIESSKIGFLQSVTPFGFDAGSQRIREIPLSSPFLQRGKEGDLKPETRNPELETVFNPA